MEPAAYGRPVLCVLSRLGVHWTYKGKPVGPATTGRIPTMISNITQEELDSIVSLTELEDVVDALLEEEQEQHDYWAELEHDYYDHDDAWQAAQDDWERNYNGGS